MFESSNYLNDLFENIFTKPLIWLNNQFFNFPYYPNKWNSISGTLILIRHIIYLILSTLGSLLWPFIAPHTLNYKKLNNWLCEILKIVLSLKVFSYGIIKVFPIQMSMPSFIDLHKTLGDLEPVYLLWNIIGYGQPYQIFLGLVEVVASILILFRKTKVIGLLLLIPIIVNVILLNYTYVIGILDVTLLLLIFNLYLLLPYLKSFYEFLLKGNSSILIYNFSNKKLKNSISNFVIVILIFSFSLKIINAYHLHIKLKSIDESRKYSEIKTFILGNDTLKLVFGDTVRWRYWGEKIINKKKLVTITTAVANNQNNYELEKDSINHILTLKLVTQNISKPIKLKYKEFDDVNWQLEGEINGKKIFVDLKRIIPEKNFILLKTERNLLNIDRKD